MVTQSSGRRSTANAVPLPDLVTFETVLTALADDSNNGMQFRLQIIPTALYSRRCPMLQIPFDGKRRLKCWLCFLSA